VSIWKHLECLFKVKCLMFNEIDHGVILNIIYQDKVMYGGKPIFMSCIGTFSSIMGRKAKYVIRELTCELSISYEFTRKLLGLMSLFGI